MLPQILLTLDNFIHDFLRRPIWFSNLLNIESPSFCITSIKKNTIMLSCPSLLAYTTYSIFPNNFVLEITITKYLVHYHLQIVRSPIITMQIYATCLFQYSMASLEPYHHIIQIRGKISTFQSYVMKPRWCLFSHCLDLLCFCPEFLRILVGNLHSLWAPFPLLYLPSKERRV